MSKCKRNIILIFGYLLCMAILFPPIEIEYGFHSRTKYVFLPTFVFNSLIVKNEGIFGKDYLNYNNLSTELAGIVLVGGFAYIVACVVLRKDARK